MREPCIHILEVRDYCKRLGITIWSEHGEDPAGWVNIYCQTCHRTLESALLRTLGEEKTE